jgi:predicted peptidase
MLVFLHGAGENGDGTAAALPRVLKLGIPMLIERGDWPEERPFVVLMPQYPEGEANDCLLADEVRAFLAFAIEHYDVDPARVYLTGISCGAIGAWDYLAAERDEVVAAAVLVAGHLESAWPLAGCELGRVPVWVLHGAMDEVVPISYVEDAIGRLEACTDPPPVEVRLTVLPGADHIGSTGTFDLSDGHDMFAWLLEHEAA